MKKCEKCQAEYEGEQCPNCQKVEQTSQPQNTPENKSFKDKLVNFINKYYAKLKLVPPLTYLAYMVLSVLFMFVCPVAVVKAAGVKYGTVFGGKGFNEIPGLHNVDTALRIFAIVSMIFTLIYALYRCVTLKYARLGKVRVSFILEIMSAVFVFVNFIFSCIIAGVINTADKGVDLVLVGSYSILSIILSIIALILIVTTIVVCYLYEKQHPELEEEFDKKYEIAKEKAKKRKKKEVSTRQKISGIVAGIICIIAIFICLGDAGIFEFEKSFSAKQLQTIVLRDNGKLNITQSGLVKKLGDAYLPIDQEDNNSDSCEYYTSNYVKLVRKKQRLSKYSEKALENASLEKMAKFLSYEMQLDTDLSNLTYGRAVVYFNSYRGVDKIVYTINSPLTSARKLVNTKLMKVSEVNADEGKKEIEYLVFMATYSDGSFVYSKVDGLNISVKLADGTTTVQQYEGSYEDFKIVWSCNDGLGKNSYEYGTTTSSYHETHNPSDTYSYNDETHWKECTYEGCTEKLYEAAHTYTEGTCVCGKTED